jgi:hypothetical protein
VDTLLSVALGIGLAAACGFRVFLPLFGVSLAAATGHLVLAPGAAWVSGTGALIALGTATLLEIVAYYVPWLDHLLDVAATPASVMAGALITASVVTGMPPLVKWALAVMAGGGTAGLVQALTVGLRLKSSLTTAGAANHLVATGELIAAGATVMVALVAPLVCLGILIVGLVFLLRRATRRSEQAQRSRQAG